MFRDRTVFIIGAGASHELGLPVGDQLMTKIVALLAPNNTHWGFGNDTIQTLLVNRAQLHANSWEWKPAMDRWREAAAKIVAALPFARSIDSYLESQQHDEDIVFIGKLAIAYAILDAEKTSYLIESPEHEHIHSTRLTKLDQSWFPPLARILTAGHRAGNVDGLFQNVSFITFNYDRLLEVFLGRMVRRYFGLPSTEATSVVANATIVHAYGQVGEILHRPGSGQTLTPLGGGDLATLEDVAMGIKTYTESADSGSMAQIQDLICNAETLVIMGFGYIGQNMRLLTPAHGTNVKRIIATAYRMSAQDKEAVADKLRQAFGTIQMIWRGEEQVAGPRDNSFRLLFEEGTCRDLMDHNIFSLADQ